MTKIDIFSGFLGAGKTTLIRKLISEAFKGEKLVLIENEFGEIAIDGGFLQDAGIEITEMSQGCICCSLVGDFGKALRQVLETYHPDRILIEPSGVGKLSDVIRAVQNLHMEDVTLNSFTTVADANKCKMYMKNFGEFYNDQIEHANSIILSRTDGIKPEKLEACVALLREHNQNATIITTPWDQLTGAQILETMEHKNTLEEELKLLAEETEHEHHHHHHDHDEHDEHCTCGCHDHHDDDEDEHEHHHHHDHDHEEHDEHCTCGCHDHHDDDEDEHEHHHHHDHDHEEHDEHCTCGCHDHDHDHDEHDHEHHHHHHADEVFTSWGTETTRKFTKDEIEHILEELDNSEKYGMILRAKGIVAGRDGEWIHFDYVPEETSVRNGSAGVIGRLCVIGSHINEAAIEALFA
ncbi:MAG: GTP-binding protein [Hominenteromicrobium sp.]|uniref:GTP-binding protein n=1 Tax=Hominenteromicrobium sp. TaxID=3073581 RepID=UPI003999DE4A